MARRNHIAAEHQLAQRRKYFRRMLGSQMKHRRRQPQRRHTLLAGSAACSRPDPANGPAPLPAENHAAGFPRIPAWKHRRTTANATEKYALASNSINSWPVTSRATARCGTTTPFGNPVDPEVNITYSGLSPSRSLPPGSSTGSTAAGRATSSTASRKHPAHKVGSAFAESSHPQSKSACRLILESALTLRRKTLSSRSGT